MYDVTSYQTTAVIFIIILAYKIQTFPNIRIVKSVFFFHYGNRVEA